MGFTGKAKSSNEGWGMGFLLVFFPEDEAVINKKKTTVNTLLRRSNSNHLLTRAQSTISICALLIFITLLLFTLSTFEPTTTTNHFTSRKHLSSNPPILYKTSRKFPHSPPPWPISLITNHKSRYRPKITSLSLPTSHALQGMGTLYRRGTRAMNDLIVAHVHESLTAHDLRLFLRVLHRSGLTSRSDIVFIFPSASQSSEFDGVIGEENDSFLKLSRRYEQMNGTEVNSRASFDATQFVKLAEEEKERKEPIWGRRIRSNYSEEGEGEGELTRLSYGSVVGFLVDELDPENSLAGFLDHVPMSLRRWACYPLLLGRVRRNFKHTMLVDVKEILVLGDPFGRVRNQSPESVYLSTVSESTTPNNKHGRKKSVKTESHKLFNPVILVGGARGVRGLSSAMLTEIARAAMQQKRKNSMSESGLFQQLVGNGFLLKNVNLISSTESIPDASSLTGLNLNSGSLLSLSNHTVIRRGNSNIDLTSIIMKQMCSLELYSSVYCDC